MRTLVVLLLCTGTPLSYAAESRPLAGQVVSVHGKVLIRSESKDAPGSRQMKVGDKLFEGDIVNTPSDGSAKILLQDKTILDIGASALFNVNKFKNAGENRDVDLGMMYGTVRANVTQKIAAAGKFKIRTPSATMGVRGTEFMVKTSINEVQDLKAANNASQGKPVVHSNNGNHYGQNKDKPSAPKTEVVVLQGKVEVAQQTTKPEAGKNSPKVEAPVVALTAGQKLVADSSSVAPAKPEQLTMEQAKAAVSQATVVDNTFKAAVTLDLGAQSGSPSSGDAGRGPAADTGVANVTAAIIKDTIVTTTEMPQPVMPVMGFAGTEAPKSDPIQLIAGGLRKVTVRIHR